MPGLNPFKRNRADRPFDFEREQVFAGYNPLVETIAPDQDPHCKCWIGVAADPEDIIVSFCDFCLTRLTAGEPLH